MKAQLQSPLNSNAGLSGNETHPMVYDQVTKDKINKHLTDINDHITEDDIRNIDTHITQKLLNSPGNA